MKILVDSLIKFISFNASHGNDEKQYPALFCDVNQFDNKFVGIYSR